MGDLEKIVKGEGETGLPKKISRDAYREAIPDKMHQR